MSDHKIASNFWDSAQSVAIFTILFYIRDVKLYSCYTALTRSGLVNLVSLFGFFIFS